MDYEVRSNNRLFQRGPSITTRVVLLIITSVLLMTLDHRQQHLKTLRDTLSIAVAPIQYLASLPTDAVILVSDAFVSRKKLLTENASLRSQRLILEAQLQKYAALESDNRRLRELLGSSFKVSDRVLIAELYKVDLDPYKHLIRLNKNRRDSVYVDQPILDAHGVMGQVTEVNLVYSTARLITDPNQVLPVQVNRNGLRTIAIGSGTIDRLELPYLPNNADIQVGDLLVTSGLGQVYPAGYPVGIVTKVTPQPEHSFADIEAKPSAHLDRSREVLLVWSGDRHNADKLAGGPELLSVDNRP